MTSKVTRLLLLLAIASPALAAEPYVPWPSKDQLNAIQFAAYNCSLNNDPDSCGRTRALADPLMDHPRLPGLCKDILWSLMEQATVASSNDYKRRDAIDTTARRLASVCAKPSPAKPATKSRSSPDQGWGPLSPSISSNDSEVETISTTLRALSRLDKRLASSQASVA